MADVVPLPRISKDLRCPYCEAECWTICRRPANHDVMHTCSVCTGVFIVRFTVTVESAALTVAGEMERVVAEQEQLLELERRRNLEDEEP